MKKTMYRMLPAVCCMGILIIILMTGINSKRDDDMDKVITFSHESGFYQEEFMLQMLTYAGGGYILYFRR